MICLSLPTGLMIQCGSGTFITTVPIPKEPRGGRSGEEQQQFAHVLTVVITWCIAVCVFTHSYTHAHTNFAHPHTRTHQPPTRTHARSNFTHT
eukprot:m.142756 g.142756  ORF g.142756 m.142756 type:complete len:93 (+) comp30269_c0_seq1:1765-2043(+)